ncbi:AAA family ATPase [Kosakonia sp. S42]|uniref:AAA family ATPase n=1 Tax=Kosakonia sp. S42 TaxID=2767458 RepID=UPI0028159121|nr:AAA family ATPase [Kosakonia sp. S42]
MNNTRKKEGRMRRANLRINNFRGVKTGFVQFGKHPVLIGDNNTGKTTLIEALPLVLSRNRLVRELIEHDFYGSNPQASDRMCKLVLTMRDWPWKPYATFMAMKSQLTP